VIPWSDRFSAKIDRKLEMYRNCPLKYENGHAFIRFIGENRHLLSDRPQTYQHGDYHIGNMMIDRCGNLIVIDFDKADWGDPWEEFNRIVWCAQKAPAFAAGMVDGYFDAKPPMDFWRLLALYICSNTLGSLPWAISFGEREIAVMREQAEDVLGWYDNMEQVIPDWYTTCIEGEKK
jgi:aminoglycoside phosphotransferase (APT) family kinase protein